MAGGEGLVPDVTGYSASASDQKCISKPSMIGQNEVRVDLRPLADLGQLFVLLESFGVTRFTVSPTPRSEQDPAIKARLAAFTQQMRSSYVGEKRTWGWPQDPELVERCREPNFVVPRRPLYVRCWSWSSETLRLLESSFADWLSEVVTGNIRWSFFSVVDLKLNVPRSDAPYFLDLFPAQIDKLRSLGLQSEVKATGPKTANIPDQAKHRQPRHYFGPHLEIHLGSLRLNRPLWWTDAHDAMILAQVAKEQWRWHSDHRRFVASISPEELEKHRALAEVQRRDGTGYYGVWYNGIGAYIYRRALELGAHKLVSTLPQWRICAICANEFHETSAREKYLGCNQLDICRPCLDESLHRGESVDLSRDEILEYLRELAALLQRVPPLDFGTPACKITNLIGLTTEQRVKVLLLLRRRPSLALVKCHFSSWFQALVVAGVLGDEAKRNLLGTTCIAKDGHVCLSIAEKTIDDFLSQRGIDHAREVPYGSGQFRADFVIGRIIVEYFGLMSKGDYQLKAQRKIEFCRKESIPLIAIYPEDLIDDKFLEQKLRQVFPVVI